MSHIFKLTNKNSQGIDKVLQINSNQTEILKLGERNREADDK